jgi:hypothetical protein
MSERAVTNIGYRQMPPFSQSQAAREADLVLSICQRLIDATDATWAALRANDGILTHEQARR